MSKYTVLAVKQVLAETDIEANNQQEAWTKAKKLNENQFVDLECEKAWKIKGIYQINEISSTQ